MVWPMRPAAALFCPAHPLGLDGAHTDMHRAGVQRLPRFSNKARAPVMATGTTGAPVLTAMRKAPPLNSLMPPSSPL